MSLPERLQESIEQEIEKYGLSHLISAREELTQRYRQAPQKQSFIQSNAQRAAYAIARLPATYAAITQVLLAIKEQASDLKIRSLLDLGAGSGAVMWAVQECFPELEKVTLIEKDAALIELGKRFAQNSDSQVLRNANWQIADLEQSDSLPPHDMVIFSYSIGELPSDSISALINKGWLSAEKILAIIEPGTPVGFERIRNIRRQLIETGGHLVAPCPHQKACPMAGGDWCHFSARLERSSYHRLLKQGSLGYEDEKFSYVAAAKDSYVLPPARVLRHPLHRSGHVILTLCTPLGIERPTISKKNGQAYKEAKKAAWGSVFMSRFN